MTSVYVPVFDGTHYECWSLKVKTLLRSLDLWDVVETGIEQEPPESYAYCLYDYSDWWKQSMKMKDVTALCLIQTALTYEIFPWIASATSSKEAWELLLVRSLGGPIFLGRKLVDLKKEYEDTKMKDSETICEFTGRLLELVFRMKSCGWKAQDKEVVKKILASLPPRFDKVFVEVAETLSLSVVIDCLLVHEYNMKQPLEESTVIQSVNVDEDFQQGAEILYSLDEITQSQVTSNKIQGEMLSLVQQNKEMLMQMQRQMLTLMQHTL